MNIVILLIFTLSLSYTLGDDITVDVFGTSNHFLPAAFGDFNADKLTDMFVIENHVNKSKSVKVLLSHSTPPYMRSDGPHCLFEKNVVSVIPSDFDGDGAMDVMVIFFQNPSYECYVLWGDLKSLNCTGVVDPVAKLNSQPLLLDYNGDMISDLYGEDYNGTRFIWIFKPDRQGVMQIPVSGDDGQSLTPLRNSGGHSFIDLDGDLSADILLSVEGGFEIWYSSTNFKTKTRIDFPVLDGDLSPNIVGQIAIFDVDMDGLVEIIVPLCSDLSCSQSLLYVYDFDTFNGSQWFNLKVNFKDPAKVEWKFPNGGSTALYTNVISPRVGDLNLDGFPDILITVTDGNTFNVILLINVECSGFCSYSRTFRTEWNTFTLWPNSVMGTFFDFLEDGNLDVVLVNASTDMNSYSVAAYKDSVQYDAMFIKVLVLTAVCYKNCSHHAIPYGTNLPGPSIVYSMTSSSGNLQKACTGQMSQTSHFALQLPFTLFGLGRNWNFIDSLKVGIEIHRSSDKLMDSTDNKGFQLSTSDTVILPSSTLAEHTAAFTQIIPNSQLVVIPFPPNKPSLWITKLFITPSRALVLTALALIATCLFVGCIIIILHLREKSQDKLEKRQQAQRFHFDAM